MEKKVRMVDGRLIQSVGFDPGGEPPFSTSITVEQAVRALSPRIEESDPDLLDLNSYFVMKIDGKRILVPYKELIGSSNYGKKEFLPQQIVCRYTDESSDITSRCKGYYSEDVFNQMFTEELSGLANLGYTEHPPKLWLRSFVENIDQNQLELTFGSIGYLEHRLYRKVLDDHSPGNAEWESFLDLFEYEGDALNDALKKKPAPWAFCGGGIFLITKDGYLVLSNRKKGAEVHNSLSYSSSGAFGRYIEFHGKNINNTPVASILREVEEELGLTLRSDSTGIQLISMGIDLKRYLMQFSFVCWVDCTAQTILDAHKNADSKAEQNLIFVHRGDSAAIHSLLENCNFEPGAAAALWQMLKKGMLSSHPAVEEMTVALLKDHVVVRPALPSSVQDSVAQLLDGHQKILDGHQKILDGQQKILDGQQQLQVGQQQIKDMLAKKLPGYLQSEHKRLLAQLKSLPSDPNGLVADAAIAASYSQSNSHIAQIIDAARTADNAHAAYDIAQTRLAAAFGDVWEIFLPTTKKSLISSDILWQHYPHMDELDYSGLAITLTCALEGELKRIFYKDFQKYLQTKGYCDPESIDPFNSCSPWPEVLLKKIYSDDDMLIGFRLGDNFTLGTLPYLFYDKEKERSRKIRSEMNNYLRTILKQPQNPENDWWAINHLDWFHNLTQGNRDPASFVSRCEYVRYTYRNPAAHPDNVTKSEAEACSKQILGTASFVPDAQPGLLMELYGHLDIEKFLALENS